jgi:hypothetical protein
MKTMTRYLLLLVVAIIVTLGACSPMPLLSDLQSATRNNALDPGGSGASLGRVWTKLTSTPMATARGYFSTTVFNNAIYVLGGSDEGGASQYKDFYSFDGTTWTARGNPTTAGGNGVVLALHDSYIHAFGGTAASIPSNVTEQYSTSIWSNAAFTGMNMRATSAGLRYNSIVYLICGKSAVGSYWSDMTYVPDAIAVMTSIPSNLGNLSGHQAVVFNNKIYVIGGTTDGNSGTATAKVSTSTGGAFSQVNVAPFSARTDFALATNGTTMYVIGGKNTSNVDLNDVWSTTDGTNWTQITTSAAFSARHGMRVEYLGGKLYLIGGIIGSTATGEVWVSQ